MIGFIGGGNMAEALVKGLVARGVSSILVAEPREMRRAYLNKAYGIQVTADNKKAAASRIVLLAVKPQNMAEVLGEIAPHITDDATVVSIAAGVPISFIQSKLNAKRVVRVMPNTAALVQEGMSVLSPSESFPSKDLETVKEIFLSVGKVLILPEAQLNAVTAVSGSGPAFIALFIEGMIQAGKGMGLSEAHASTLAVQTLLGTAKLLDTDLTPHRLRDMVTSPGGTTAAGLKVFEAKGLKQMVTEALIAAQKRAEELGK